MTQERVINVAAMQENEVNSVIDFFHRQFISLGNEPDRHKRWIDLTELAPRLQAREGIDHEIISVVVKDDNNIVGAAIAYRAPFSHELWSIPVLAVEKGSEYQGVPPSRGQGIGKRLVEKIFQEVKERGGKTVATDTNKLHKRGGSPEFLETCGFVKVGEIPGYYDGRPDETGIYYIHHV